MSETRYFVLGGESEEALASFWDDRKRADRAIRKFMKDIGASDVYTSSDSGRITTVSLSGEVDRDTWAKSKFGWRPKQRTAAGKAMRDRIDKLPAIPGPGLIQKACGFKMILVGTSNGLSRPTPGMSFLAGRNVVSIKDPKRQQPVPPGATEIKASEYWAMRESEDAKAPPGRKKAKRQKRASVRS